MRYPRRSPVRLCVEILESRVALSALTTSTNWSGYAVQTDLDAPAAHAFTAVKGSWVVPAVKGRGLAFASVWVGIDGYSSGTVEQIGTDSDIINGRPVYYAWYEMYPRPSVTINRIAIEPGDSVTAQVTFVAGVFALSLSNDTTGASFSVARSMAGAQRSSAEWIVEAPSSDGGTLPLANFGSVSFTNATATINGATGPIDSPATDDASINMVAHRRTEAVTSGITDTGDGSSFQVTFVSSVRGPMRQHRRMFRDTNAATLISALTAAPATSSIAQTIDVPPPVATPLVRLVTPLSGTPAPLHNAARLTDIGFTSDVVANEEDGAAAPPAGQRTPAAQPMPVAPMQQGPAATPRETRPPIIDNDVQLPDEQALSALFAEMAANEAVLDAPQAEAGSPAQMAALASVLVFMGAPFVNVPERKNRRQLQSA